MGSEVCIRDGHAHGAAVAHDTGDGDGHAYSIDWTRNALTLLFFALTYAGFALVLAAVMSVRPALPTPWQGILWLPRIHI